MSPAKKKENKNIVMTRQALRAWMLLVFVALGGMFYLGLQVGRGMAPPPGMVVGVEQSIAYIRDFMTSKDQESSPDLGTDFDLQTQLKNDSGDLYFDPIEPRGREENTDLRGKGAQPRELKKAAGPSKTLQAKAGQPLLHLKKSPDNAADKAQEDAKPAKAMKRPRLMPTEISTQPDGRWAIQISAVTKESDARHLQKRLSANNFPAYVLAVARPGEKTLYRVRVGRFGSKDNADKVLEMVRRLVPDAFIVMGR